MVWQKLFRILKSNMSPTSKSKSKDKRVGKEPQKSSSKPTSHSNAGGGGVPASGYNPLLGTFHALETAPVPSAPNLHVSGRFRNIDETDDHSGNSYGTGTEYDSVSNNDSWSGESEDHKEKISHSSSHQEAIPGAENDKREKIRQKNERKHQRQKERRAQELQEKCSGYLMSRKLDALAQQLVAMGFSSERATMALILNEGKVEDSVAWLLEGGEAANTNREHNIDGGGNLKIDISEELARIEDMEIRYKCSKQEVERAIVASEGDLEKADEALKARRLEPPVLPKPEETGDPPTVSNGKLQVPISQNLTKIQSKASTSPFPQKRDEKDVTRMKVDVAVGTDSGNNSVQTLKRIQPKLEWAKSPQFVVPVEKRWPGVGSNIAVACSVASSLQTSSPPAISETQYVSAGSKLKNLQLGSVREPVLLMQRPQSTNTRQPPSSVSLSPPGTASGLYPGTVETMKSSGLMPHISSTRGLGPNNASTNQLHNQYQYQQVQQIVSTNGSLDPLGTSQMNGLWTRPGTSQTLAAASSLGLFSGIGSNGSQGSSSSIDWNTGSSLQFHYTNIDWSMDGGSSISRPSGMWPGINSFIPNNALIPDSCNSGRNFATSMRPLLSNENGVSIVGLQHGVDLHETTAVGSRECTPPFGRERPF